MSTQPESLLTPEQYLEIERKAEYKSEYWNGRMFAMSGASEEHNTITMNLSIHLGPQARAHGCRPYANEMRVRVTATGLYTYPDFIVVCDKPQLIEDQLDTLLNPTLLIEVLSPSTEAYERGRGFDHYRKLDSLAQYLLISQDRMHADLFTRQRDCQWSLRDASRPEDVLDLPSIGCQIRMADLYQDVTLPQPGEPS